MYIFCEETVKRWMDDFKNEGRDIDEEIKDIKADIENNKLWKKGSLTKEGASCHEQNIADLTEYLARLEKLAKEIKKPNRKPRNKKDNNFSLSNPFDQPINHNTSPLQTDEFNNYMETNKYMNEEYKRLFGDNKYGYNPCSNPLDPMIRQIYGITIDSVGRLYLEIAIDRKWYIVPVITNKNIAITEFINDDGEEFLPHLYELNWDHNKYLFKCKEGLNEKILGLVFKEMHIDIQTKLFGQEDLILEKIFYCLMKYKKIIKLPFIEPKMDENGNSTDFSFKKYKESFLYRLDNAREYN